jgi:hypothetical protein
VGGWRLTIRHGSQVERRSFEDLEDTLEAAREAAETVQAEGNLEEISAFSDYSPGQRVHARLEISSPGFARGREAGIDVMGDGALVPYTGVLRKRKLEPGRGESPFDALRDALANGR